MSRRETIKTANKSLSLLSRATRFFTASRAGRHFADAKSENGQESPREQAFSGGYNEAFVMQFWASYNPRH